MGTVTVGEVAALAKELITEAEFTRRATHWGGLLVYFE
jgi:hypothetical protein